MKKLSLLFLSVPPQNVVTSETCSWTITLTSRIYLKKLDINAGDSSEDEDSVFHIIALFLSMEITGLSSYFAKLYTFSLMVLASVSLHDIYRDI